MSEENQEAAADQLQFNIQKIYLKDCSFETPNSPAIFMKDWSKLKISLEIRNSASELQTGMHEVVLVIIVTANIEDQVAYLVEVSQAGIFEIKGLPGEALSYAAGISCPQILFPYAREAISDLVTKGGFPQMVLNPVNFEALFEQHRQQRMNNEDKTKLN